jgi:hypothetical protein
MDIATFWANCRIKEKEINAAIANSVRQPRDGTVLLTSTFGPPNRLTEAVIWPTAARCVFEGSHRLSTDAEIAAYETEMSKKRFDRQSGVAAGTTKVL